MVGTGRYPQEVRAIKRNERIGLVPVPGERETMPNPKRRHSKARTSSRRAHDFLTAHSASECPNCHEKKMPHRVCAKCGYYKGREVVQVKEKA
jgi:large subunit ribosomal protein L32